MSELQSRPPLARFQLIIGQLNEADCLTINYLAKLLEVDRRTVERDIEFLRDQLGHPIEVSWRGVRLTQKVQVCPICAGKHRNN